MLKENCSLCWEIKCCVDVDTNFNYTHYPVLYIHTYICVHEHQWQKQAGSLVSKKGGWLCFFPWSPFFSLYWLTHGDLGTIQYFWWFCLSSRRVLFCFAQEVYRNNESYQAYPIFIIGFFAFFLGMYSGPSGSSSSSSSPALLVSVWVLVVLWVWLLLCGSVFELHMEAAEVTCSCRHGSAGSRRRWHTAGVWLLSTGSHRLGTRCTPE